LHYYVYLLGGRPIGQGKRGFISSIPSTYASKLMRIGVPYGNKTINIPRIDLSALDDSTWEYYIKATLTEEGTFVVSQQRYKESLHIYIKFGRTYDITHYIDNSRYYVSSLGRGYHSLHKIRKRYPELYKYVYSHPHPYLLSEYKEWIRRDPVISDSIHLYPQNLYITKDERITIHWIMIIIDKEALKYVLNKYFFMPYSFKEYMALRFYDILTKYEKYGLTPEIRKEIQFLHENRVKLFN
jgi:hypothetical protein